VSPSEDSVPEGVAVSDESELELAAFSEDKWLWHQLNVADTEPPVSEISALKAVESSAGEVAVAEG